MKNMNFLHVVMAVISLTVAFVLFPTTLGGVAAITGHANIADYTGLDDIANIVPLLSFVWLIFIGGAAGFSAYSGGNNRSNTRNVAYLSMTIVGLAIVLYVFPVILDGCNSILTHASIADFTGLDDIVAIAPLILLVTIVFSGGILSWKASGASGAIGAARRRFRGGRRATAKF